MSIVEKMLEASNKTRRHLDPTGSMRMEAALKALLTATGLSEAKLEGLANGTMVCVPLEPTVEMMSHFAGTNFLSLPANKRTSELNAYRAMLAAKEGV